MKTILPKVFLVKIIALAAIFIFLDAVYARDKIYIYSGAGVADAVKAVITSYKKVSPDTGFVTVFASAGDHARQIESGADADVFISADIIWVKYLDDKKLVEKGTAGIFASNELVIVASPNAKNRFKSPEKLLE
ncbi:MAG: molybdate ABC transporter substrate-binding protein, partial [Spirochaetes bacterium]|nr:molybdate ABC transporter substrate-binding protein [Spirochaetota bacterium]